MGNFLNAIGLMSGTSLDGVDVSLVRTDGKEVSDFGPSLAISYPVELQNKIRQILNNPNNPTLLEKEITLFHAKAVEEFLLTNQLDKKNIDVIGFHGQTIWHNPHEAITWQVGNGSLLAELTGINVVCDFRRRDMAAGGQGAPLVPLYHQALMRNMPKPIVVLNIGGVSNVTWLGEQEEVIAFDLGPGNALINDWIYKRQQKLFDHKGELASQGMVNQEYLNQLLQDKFFLIEPPKSLDRNHFVIDFLNDLSDQDGAATLTNFTAHAIALAEHRFLKPPKEWFVCGGGRHNDYLMQLIGHLVSGRVRKIEEIGHDGDFIESQAFAYLAVRSLYGMVISLPTTTGVTRSVTGGAFYRA